jgi:hypothetical protein
MQAQLPILMLLLVLMVMFALFAWLHAHKTPRQMRQVELWVMPLLLLVMVLGIVMQVAQRRVTYATFLFAGMVVWHVLRLYFRAQEEPFLPTEAMGNYSRDPRHCGQCNYDLTGNVSGICPECGWQVPAKVPTGDDVSWTFWWKRWRIEHMDDWRKQRNSAAFGAVAFGVIAIVMVILKAVAVAAVISLIVAQFAINTGRLIAYGRRQRHDPTV